MIEVIKHFLIISIVICSINVKAYFAIKPGLPIPTWYKAKFSPIKTPEFGKKFRLKFELQNLLGDLQDIELKLLLPEGIKNLNNPLFNSKKVLRKADSHTWHWDLVVEREVLGKSIQLKVSSSFPREEITRFALGQYDKEPSHQKTQLINKIENIKERVDLHFQTTVYCSKIEGFPKVPDLIFKDNWKPNNFQSPLVMYQYKNPRLTQRDQILKQIKEFEDYYARISKNDSSINKFKALRPAAYLRMLEDNFYNYYALAIDYFKEKDYQNCDIWLQKLSLLILSQEDLNSELFLAIQNTRALCNVALKKFPEARKILKSSVQTEI
ncbi:MAG: hypothetical protein VX619_11300, partial [bacterium]|nr:hypothetical protein [bacterium]